MTSSVSEPLRLFEQTVTGAMPSGSAYVCGSRGYAETRAKGIMSHSKCQDARHGSSHLAEIC